jgi:transposase InsO family protein
MFCSKLGGCARKRDRTAKSFLKTLLEAPPFRIQTYLTDNGSEFPERLLAKTGKPTGTPVFDQTCAAHSIEPCLTPPRRPPTNGMVERFHGRLREVLQSHPFDSTADRKSPCCAMPTFTITISRSAPSATPPRSRP